MSGDEDANDTSVSDHLGRLRTSSIRLNIATLIKQNLTALLVVPEGAEEPEDDDDDDEYGGAEADVPKHDPTMSSARSEGGMDIDD